MFHNNSEAYVLSNEKFKSFDNTGWVYVFKFHKPENVIHTEAIQRGLGNIFQNIEFSIKNRMTKAEREVKKDEDTLTTEKNMEKYIGLLKQLN